MFGFWSDQDYNLEEYSHRQYHQSYNLYNSSPPPPYSKEDLLDFKPDGSRISDVIKPIQEDKATKTGSGNLRKQSYDDVGEEIIVTIHVVPDKEIGLVLLDGTSFTPSWPTIMDVKADSPAYYAFPRLKIGDQIKELDCISTETLTHQQVLTLFSKATDSIVMTLRRGIEPTKRDFEWFRFPFLSVSKTAEDIVLSHSPNPPQRSYQDSTPSKNLIEKFSTFLEKCQDDWNDEKKRIQAIENRHLKHSRSYSTSAASKYDYLGSPKERRLTNEDSRNGYNTRLNGYYSTYHLTSAEYQNSQKSRERKYITNEVERMNLEKNGGVKRNILRNSLATSSSTIASASSTSNVDEIQGFPTGYIITNFNRSPAEELQDSDRPLNRLNKISTENINHFIRAPVNKIRDSFRRKKNKADPNFLDELENSHSIQSTENTLNLTVWIPDRMKLGLKLADGIVSLYGHNNICVIEVKKTGIAYKYFKVGDELLEVDGVSTNGLDASKVNKLISKLEGNFVEFKVYRPSSI